MMNEQNLALSVFLRWHLSHTAALESLMETQRVFLEQQSFSVKHRWLIECEQRIENEKLHFEAKELNAPHAPSVTQAETIIQQMQLFCCATASIEEKRRRDDDIQSILDRRPSENASQDEKIKSGLSIAARFQGVLGTWEYGVDFDSKLHSSLNSLNEAFTEFQAAFDEENHALLVRWLEEWKSRKTNLEQLTEKWFEDHPA